MQDLEIPPVEEGEADGGEDGVRPTIAVAHKTRPAEYGRRHLQRAHGPQLPSCARQ